MTSRRPWLPALAALMLAVALTPTQSANAQPKPAQLLAAGSEIAFTTRQLGVPVEGRFGRFSAQIALDPKLPASSSVAFSIDTGSARFGSPELDAEVPKATWLHVAKFPQASFQSSAIKAAGPGRFEVTGALTIKGVARQVTVPVQLLQNGGSGIGSATGSFVLPRTAFKVGDGEWTDTSLLADEVQVRFKLALAGLPAP